MANGVSKKIVREVLSWCGTILAAILIAVFINAYIFRSSRVSGDSMRKTLRDGQNIFISRLPYWFGDPAYGDIVVFDSEDAHRNFFVEIRESFQYNVVTYSLGLVSHPQKYWIKRVIGVPGDVIEIREEGVYRNGVLLEEDYVNREETLNYTNWIGKSWEVSEGQLFVMGDNRNHSMDSRVIGVISENAVLGKVVKQE